MLVLFLFLLFFLAECKPFGGGGAFVGSTMRTGWRRRGVRAMALFLGLKKTSFGNALRVYSFIATSVYRADLEQCPFSAGVWLARGY